MPDKKKTWGGNKENYTKKSVIPTSHLKEPLYSKSSTNHISLINFSFSSGTRSFPSRPQSTARGSPQPSRWILFLIPYDRVSDWWLPPVSAGAWDFPGNLSLLSLKHTQRLSRSHMEYSVVHSGDLSILSTPGSFGELQDSLTAVSPT